MLIRFLVREIRHSGAQALTYVLCVGLAIATLMALNSLKRDVQQSLLNDAQALHGGDVILHSHYPFSQPVLDILERLTASGTVESTKTYEFYSMARLANAEKNLFARIKAVDRLYPLYGSIELASGRDFKTVLQSGKAIVAPEVLQRLSLPVGGRLLLGSVSLEVADTIVYDASSPVSVFSLGPRIYVSQADLAEIGLLGNSSRSNFEILLKLGKPERADEVARLFEGAAKAGQERVETAKTARSGVKRFFDNLLFFLSFISIFTLVLSGIGIQSSLAALLRKKQRSIATVKLIGASHRFLFVHYLAIALGLGLTGCVGGVLAGYGIKRIFPLIFGGVLPSGTSFSFTPTDSLEGLALGLTVVLVFSFLPLYKIGTIKPVALIRHEMTGKTRLAVTLSASGAALIFLVLLVLRQLEDVKIGLYFVGGCLAFILLIFLLTTVVLALIRRMPVRRLIVRLSLRSLFRPGNATRPVVVTLVSALTVLLSIYLVEYNLVSSFIVSYPADAPNLFCLDIQESQRQDFNRLAGRNAELFPVVRARLVAINDNPIEAETEQKRRGDSLSREFNLTYRDDLLEDEILVEGKTLFGSSRVAPGMVEVSVLDTIADIGDIKVGDRLSFNIQGVPVEAGVTTIRSRVKSKLFPFFYFVFPSQVLNSAPHTLFAALHIEPAELPATISRIVAGLPNVSTINVGDTAARLGELIRRLAGIITFFSFFSLFAGCLILVSSLLATRLERIRDVVYYKILGGRVRFVLAVQVCEGALLGLISSLLAVVCANISAWLLCRYYFEVSYLTNWYASLALVVSTNVVIIAVGLLGSRGVVRQKPSIFLQQQETF